MANSLLLRKEVFKASRPDSPEAELIQPLLLSQDLEVHERRDDLLVIKNIRCKTHLVVNRQEWKLLNRYSNKPMSILDLFPDLIRDRACPALTDMIELLLKARRRFILVTLGTQPPMVAPAEWSMKLSYPLAHFFSLFCIAIGFVSLIFMDLTPPDNALYFAVLAVVGWIMICGCISLGNFFAACLLNGMDCELSKPDVNLKTVFPHFTFDDKDVLMGGVRAETGMAQVQVAPIFLLVAGSTWVFPELAMIALLGMLYQLAPLQKSPPLRFLQALFRGPQRSITTDFVYDLGTGPLGRMKRSLSYLIPRYAFIESLYALAWMAVCGLLVYLVFVTGALGELLQESFGSDSGQYVILGTVGIALLAIVYLGFSKLFAQIFASFKKVEKGMVDEPEQHVELTAEQVTRQVIEDLLVSMPFGQMLTMDSIRFLAARAQHRFYEENQLIYEIGDTFAHYPIVLFGQLEVEQQARTGRFYSVRKLNPGEAFGEDELMDQRPTNYQVRANRRTCVVFIDSQAFEKEVVARVGRQRIQEIMQKEGLLKEVKLSRVWDPETIQRFAKLCVINEYKDGSIVLPDNFDNRFFYIIYQGIFSVRKKRKMIAKLRRGDFFGEISLLQNSQTTSDVVSEEKGRAFTVSKGDFLRFMMTDFRVAIQIERIASKRLGYPLFPFQSGRRR